MVHLVQSLLAILSVLQLLPVDCTSALLSLSSSALLSFLLFSSPLLSLFPSPLLSPSFSSYLHFISLESSPTSHLPLTSPIPSHLVVSFFLLFLLLLPFPFFSSLLSSPVVSFLRLSPLMMHTGSRLHCRIYRENLPLPTEIKAKRFKCDQIKTK